MHTCTKNSTAWALVVVWVLALTISIHDGMFTRIPMEYEAGVKEYNSEFEYQRKELSFLPNKTVWEKEKRQVYQVDENLIPVTVKACKIMVSDMHYKTLQVVYFVVCYLLPSLIMVVCYGLILRKLFTRRLMTQLKRVVSRTAKRLEATRRRHTINIILLVGVYIALWGPYLTYKLFLTFKTTKDILDAVAALNVLKFLTLFWSLIRWRAIVRFGQMRQILSWGSTLPAKVLEETADWKACKLWSYDGSNNDLCNSIWTANQQHPVSHMIHRSPEDLIVLNGSCALSKSQKATPTFFLFTMVNSSVGLWWSTDLIITRQITHTKFSYLGLLALKQV